MERSEIRGRRSRIPLRSIRAAQLRIANAERLGAISNRPLGVGRFDRADRSDFLWITLTRQDFLRGRRRRSRVNLSGARRG